jgi:hypothetical protein
MLTSMTSWAWDLVWGRPRLGDRIRDPDGDVWTVDDVTDDRFHVVIRSGLAMWMYYVDDELIERPR